MKIIIEIDSHDAGDGEPSLTTRSMVAQSIRDVARDLMHMTWDTRVHERGSGRWRLEDV